MNMRQTNIDKYEADKYILVWGRQLYKKYEADIYLLIWGRQIYINMRQTNIYKYEGDIYMGQKDQDEYYVANCHIFINFEAEIHQFKNHPGQK